MKVLALNSSPRGGGHSKTELMLHHLVIGLRDEGADVTVAALREKTIKNCVGCFTCWTRTPGKCIHEDDMSSELMPKWLEADLVVYATPLYNYAVTSLLKAFLERTLPALEPFFEIKDCRMYHPVRSRCPAVAVLSVSGMPDMGHFGPLSSHMRYYYESPGRRLVAEIYRPAAELLVRSFFSEKAEDVFDATRQAGRELVRSMTISTETMARITQPFVEPQIFAEFGNTMFRTCIDEGVTLEEFFAKNMVPRSDSLRSFLIIFPMGINVTAIADRRVVLQFTFSGQVEGSCYFVIEKGTVQAQEGVGDNPDVTIVSPFEVWIDIMTGKADGRQMLMERKYRAEGDISLMTRLFRRN
jgi:multimeric flavodoxin WrbA